MTDESVTNYDRMAAGELYQADDPRIIAEQAEAVAVAEKLHRAYASDPQAAQIIAAELFGSFGEDAFVRAPIYVDYGKNIHIGARTFLNYGCTALDVAPIRIGDDCQIATGVQLLTPTHPLDADLRRDKWEAAEPITIGDNVWLGGGVIVCPGVTIGDNSVVGAGSVVVKDIPAWSLAVGNPARVIRSLRTG